VEKWTLPEGAAPEANRRCAGGIRRCGPIGVSNTRRPFTVLALRTGRFDSETRIFPLTVFKSAGPERRLPEIVPLTVWIVISPDRSLAVTGR
jgi:hypothetical protein